MVCDLNETFFAAKSGRCLRPKTATFLDFLPTERQQIHSDGIRLFHMHYWHSVLSRINNLCVISWLHLKITALEALIRTLRSARSQFLSSVVGQVYLRSRLQTCDRNAGLRFHSMSRINGSKWPRSGRVTPAASFLLAAQVVHVEACTRRGSKLQPYDPKFSTSASPMFPIA